MTNDELLTQARARFKEAEEAERENRVEAMKDLMFIAGEQWDERMLQERMLADRPALTVNKLPTFVAQVVNDARQNKPSIKISAVDSGVDVDTADVTQGLIRHIENDSEASVAYITAFEYAVQCGFGAFRIKTDYCDDESFDQEILVEPIPDPFSVYYDPLSKKADRSDARYCFVVEKFSRDVFADLWPGSLAVTSNFFDGEFDQYDGWITQDTVTVAEYWRIETKRRKLLYLPTGQTVFADEAGELPEGVTPLREREVLQRTVKVAKINGAEVLEEDDWPIKWFGIIPVYGKELMVAGKRRLFGMIRFARDPQQLYNYYVTAEAETIGLSPKTPFIGVEGQFEGHEQKWQTANRVAHAYLEYKNVSVNGQLAPPPQRNQYEPPIRALSIGAAKANDDIKATTGIFDASLGARSNETSGVAISRRQAEGDTANFHFLDNFGRAQRQAGRVIVGMIPRIYDTPRWIRILGEDQTKRVVKVNELYRDEKGRTKNYDLSMGKYDVAVSTGPSYMTKREQAFGMMTEFARAYPQLLQIAGDLVFRNSDIPGADEIAERFKRTLPPNLAADKDDEQPIPPQFKAQLEAAMQQIEQLTAALNQATEETSSKRLELESRERIETLKAEVSLIETLSRLENEAGIELLRQQIAAIGRRYAQLETAERPQTKQPIAA